MEAAIGLQMCMLLLLLVGSGVGFLVMNRRVSRLQKRLEEVEFHLGAAVELPARVAPPPVAQPVTQVSSPAAAPVSATIEQASVVPAAESRPSSLPSSTADVASSPVAPARSPRKPLPLVDWFLKSHILVQIGLIVLFIGVALLLRYAVDQGWLSLEIRHIGAALGGVLLGAIGWAVRSKQRAYGLALEGGGLAILYLTTFSAYQFYALLPAPVAFGVFVALGGLGMALALLQNARIFAYAALIGAFAAPLLVAEDGGSYAGLLGYYLLLTIVALGLAVRRGWQGLGVLSLLFTYGVGIAHTIENYDAADGTYLGMQLFVALFFALYLAASLLFAQRKSDRRQIGDVVIGVLNPIFVITWQLVITNAFDKGAGYSLLTGSAIYLALFGVLIRRGDDRLTLHRELSLFWALFMASAAVPIFFAARITATIWAVAGAAWVWLAQRRSAGWLAPWGLITQAGAGLAFLSTVVNALDSMMTPATGQPPFLSDFALGWAMIGVAGLASSYFLTRSRLDSTAETQPNAWRSFAPLVFAWGVAWWFGGGMFEATTVPEGFVVSALVLYVTLSTTAMALIGRRLAFAWLELPLWGLLPALIVLALLQPLEIDSPLQGGAWLVWPLAVIVYVWMLRRNDDSAHISIYHAGGVWLVTYLAAAALNGLLRQADAGETVVTSAILALLAAIIWGVTAFAGRMPAPIGPRAATYRLWGIGPVVVAGVILLVMANLTVDGATAWLPFLPLLNPLALASAAMLAATLTWLFAARADVAEMLRPVLWSLRWAWWALLIFCMSAELARSVHHLLGAPLTWDGLYTSAIFQTLLAVLWSVTALGLMVWGSRRRSRSSWFAGAVVLGLTLVKLFLVDLAGVGAVARIVSFIGVGLLILVIAFVAPAPPKEEIETVGD
ncbi:MAG: DUF2339 domain-containing protein [Caldilinea sp.]